MSLLTSFITQWFSVTWYWGLH